jgi:chemotaxis protein methyltransferase CheR
VVAMSMIVSEDDVELFLAYVKKYKGMELDFYRKSFLARRMQGRFEATNCNSLIDYIKVLKHNPAEWNFFLDKLSINVSEFFRDPEVFKFFEEVCIPELIDNHLRKKEKYIRCWSCGCSCGEEAYSIAILFKEVAAELGDELFIRVHATDVDEDALSKAAKGEYLRKSLVNYIKIGPDILSKYFTFDPDSGVYRVQDEIKKMLVIGKNNLLSDEPLKHMDVIFFRNVRIYFGKNQADEIISRIHAAMKKGAYLVLGKVETMGLPVRSLFEPVHFNNKIFRKI